MRRQVGEELAGGRLELLAARLPGVRDGEKRQEPGAPPPVVRGVVGAPVERQSVGGQEQRERPAAAAGHRLDRGHVDVVQVRALLAIHFDRDEPCVQGIGDPAVLEGLPFHHVAPVAGRVPDREEDGLLLRLRASEGFRAPRVPVDRIVLVLEQVRTLFAREPIGHGGTITPAGDQGFRRTRTNRPIPVSRFPVFRLTRLSD